MTQSLAKNAAFLPLAWLLVEKLAQKRKKQKLIARKDMSTPMKTLFTKKKVTARAKLVIEKGKLLEGQNFVLNDITAFLFRYFALYFGYGLY